MDVTAQRGEHESAKSYVLRVLIDNIIVRRNVYNLTVYGYELVVNDLSCFLTGSCESKTEYYVVKS